MKPEALLALLADLYESATPIARHGNRPDPFAWKERAATILMRYRDEAMRVARATRQLPDDFSFRWESKRYQGFWFELRARWPDDVVVFGDLHDWFRRAGIHDLIG